MDIICNKIDVSLTNSPNTIPTTHKTIKLTPNNAKNNYMLNIKQFLPNNSTENKHDTNKLKINNIA